MELKLMSEFRYVEFEALVGDDTGAIEGVVEPEVGSQRMMSGGGDNTVFESVAGREAEDADGFDADVVVGGVVHNSRVGIVGDRARQNVGDATAGMRDAHERDFNLLERAIVAEVETSELACANFGINFDDAVNFFAGIAVAFEADAGFEEGDLDLSRGCFLRFGRLLRFLRGSGEENCEQR